MKRMIKATAAFCLCLLLLPLLFSCKDGKDEPVETNPPANKTSKFLYESDGDSITITGYSGIESTVSIPAKLDGLPVTKIAENAFRGFTYLNKIYLPDTVQVIDYAFVSCPDLTYVRLGKGITSMNGAFRGCRQLKTVEGSTAVQYMDEAFRGCSSLQKGYVGSTVISAASAYADCASLTEVTVEEGIAALDSTFENCISLSAVHLPDSLRDATRTFVGCTSLTEATGGNGILTMDSTFRDCPLLPTFQLSQELTVMKEAFLNCQSLTEVVGMPESLSVYSASFTGCRSLVTLVIPAIEDTEALAAYSPAQDIKSYERLTHLTVLCEFPLREEFCKVFAGCLSLESLTLPESLARAMLRVSYTYTDSLFEGENKELEEALKKWRKEAAARLTDDYGRVGIISYTRIYGGDVETFDPDALAAEADVLSFEPYEKASYWCGYPKGGNRKTDTIGIARTFSFFLRTTGKNDGTLPETLTVNGKLCRVGE